MTQPTPDAWPDKTMFRNLEGRVNAVETRVRPAVLSYRRGLLSGPNGDPSQAPVDVSVLRISLPSSPAAVINRLIIDATFSLADLFSIGKTWGIHPPSLGFTVEELKVTSGAPTVVAFPAPVALYPDEDLTLQFRVPVQMYTRDALSTDTLSCRAQHGENVVGAVRVQALLAERTVLGPLAADGMNVVNVPTPPGDGVLNGAPLPFLIGHFEIVDPAEGAPYLRYRAGNGTVYTLPMASEAPSESAPD